VPDDPVGIAAAIQHGDHGYVIAGFVVVNCIRESAHRQHVVAVSVWMNSCEIGQRADVAIDRTRKALAESYFLGSSGKMLSLYSTSAAQSGIYFACLRITVSR